LINTGVSKILKKYGSSGGQDADDNKSLISFNENQREVQLEKELASYKERLQNSEEIRDICK
jgi:hypothetical protein